MNKHQRIIINNSHLSQETEQPRPRCAGMIFEAELLKKE